MPELNVDIPAFKTWVRKEFLHNHESGKGEFERCLVFAVRSVPNRAIGFRVLLESGSCLRPREPMGQFIASMTACSAFSIAPTSWPRSTCAPAGTRSSIPPLPYNILTILTSPITHLEFASSRHTSNILPGFRMLFGSSDRLTALAISR